MDLKLLELSTNGSMHMLNWKHAHAQQKSARAHSEACKCSTGSVHVLTWNTAQLGVYSVPVPTNYPSHFKLPAISRNTSISTEQREFLWKSWCAHTWTFVAQPKYALNDAKTCIQFIDSSQKWYYPILVHINWEMCV